MLLWGTGRLESVGYLMRDVGNLGITKQHIPIPFRLGELQLLELKVLDSHRHRKQLKGTHSQTQTGVAIDCGWQVSQLT